MEKLNSVHPLFLAFLGIICGIGLFLLGYHFRRYRAQSRLRRAQEEVQNILENAKREAESRKREAELEAKDLLFRTRTRFEKETEVRRYELLKLEKRLMQKESNLDRKVDLLEKNERDIRQAEKNLETRTKGLETREQELANLIKEEKEKLQRIAGMSSEQAKKLLLERLEGEVRQDAGLMIKRIEEEARETADKKAREVIGLAIQRCAAEHVVESTVSVVNLPDDEMKGRIIGREGRNIRALETATGIDVIVDDTPGAVILSGFDMVRREIARQSLERLISDGRIHPGRIEEIVEKVKKEVESSIREEGQKMAFDLGISGLHPEIVRLVGRLRYRTSYGQNVLQHSREVAYLMGVMASEMKLDVTLAKRAGLLHDLGKAVDQEMEGTHARIGASLAKRYGESPAIIHAIEAHHQDIEPQTVMAVLVQAADAISATRPGARRETLESYIERLEKLEAIADAFKGVEKSYAIQAGREIRVIVQPEKMNDEEVVVLAREISKKIESELEYPGQVKVTVIRETRAVEYAK